MKGSMTLPIACILVSVLVLSCQPKPTATSSTTTSSETPSTLTPAETTSTTTPAETPSTTTPASEQTLKTAETAEPATPAISDDKYRPPQGNYAYDFSLGSGDRLDEYYWPTSFETVQSSDFGGWKSIEFMRIKDEFLPIPEDSEESNKYLDSDLNALMERRITPEIPNGKIIYQEYLQKDTTILFAVLDLPGGSNMLINGKPDNAIRGVYIVIQGAYSYVVSTQVSTGMFTKSKTQEEYIQQLKQELASFYGGIKFETDLDVGRDFVPPPPTPALDPADWIPTMKIPDGLFFPDKGSDNFANFGVALMTKGDWILYKGGIRSILPVPKGWTTQETGQKTYIYFIPSGDPQGELTIQISLGAAVCEDESTNSEEIIDEFLEDLEAIKANCTVIKRQIIDADRGYVFLKVKTDSGTYRYFLEIFSKTPKTWGDTFFFTFAVFTNEEDWDQYYPIIVAIVKNWYTYDGVSLGFQLPDTLVK